jgi:endogenous inhibitor of DNA gyrase (YacG/DUF329 family)
MPLCPTCKKPVADDTTAFPFCNPRCKLLDLGNWMSGRYVVSSPLPFDEDTGLGGSGDHDGKVLS